MDMINTYCTRCPRNKTVSIKLKTLKKNLSVFYIYKFTKQGMLINENWLCYNSDQKPFSGSKGNFLFVLL